MQISVSSSPVLIGLQRPRTCSPLLIPCSTVSHPRFVHSALHATHKFRHAEIPHFLLFFRATRICLRRSVRQDGRWLCLSQPWGVPPGRSQGPGGLTGDLLITCQGLWDAISFCLIPLGVFSPGASELTKHTEPSSGVDDHRWS